LPGEGEAGGGGAQRTPPPLCAPAPFPVRSAPLQQTPRLPPFAVRADDGQAAALAAIDTKISPAALVAWRYVAGGLAALGVKIACRDMSTPSRDQARGSSTPSAAYHLADW